MEPGCTSLGCITRPTTSSLLEWHPFTISSGPERNGVGFQARSLLDSCVASDSEYFTPVLRQELTLHVRVASETGWTMALRKMLETREQAACAAEERDLVLAPAEERPHTGLSNGIRRRLIHASEPAEAGGSTALELLARAVRRRLSAWIHGVPVDSGGADPSRPVSSRQRSAAN